MTNKTKLLACPFCKQQDAFVEQLDSDASVVICQGSVGEHEACLCRGPVGVQQSDDEDQPGYDEAVRLWNLRAAPAEDVRAVVEEPVAYFYKEYVWATGLCDYVWRTKLEAEAPTDDQDVKDIEPLYRHRHRPVVLPGRQSVSLGEFQPFDRGYSIGFNACLDAVEELNK